MTDDYALTLSCPNRPGIVAAVAHVLHQHGANIIEAHQFDDLGTNQFFARIRFDFVGESHPNALRGAFACVADKFSMDWTIRDLAVRQRVLVMVSRHDHCLADLLYRWHIGELAMDLAGIVSNHPPDTYQHLHFEGVPFDYLPIAPDNKQRQEEHLWRIVTDRQIDLVVLARYMQVLSQEMTAKLAGRCINIHHSFLPGFKGAKPYHQAYERGVKLIGATAHYVTQDLDEGPIIEQDVETVAHFDTAQALIRKGRDIERRVLSRAVTWHLQGRVFLNGLKTIVFKD